MVVEGEQDFAVKLVIGFHSNQLCERGTEVAMYDYAYCNQKIYGNKSIRKSWGIHI